MSLYDKTECIYFELDAATARRLRWCQCNIETGIKNLDKLTPSDYCKLLIEAFVFNKYQLGK